MIIEARDVLLNILDPTLRDHIVDLMKSARLTEGPDDLALYAPTWFYKSVEPLMREVRMEKPMILGLPLYPNTDIPSLSYLPEEERAEEYRRFFVKKTHLKLAA